MEESYYQNEELGSRDRSTAQLMRELSEQTSALVRQEVELAKAEVRVKGKEAGLGAGMFGFYALGALTATLILVLATALAAWVAALIVTAMYAAIAGVLALQGKNKLRAATPPVPKQAVESSKEDVAWVRSRAKSAHQ